MEGIGVRSWSPRAAMRYSPSARPAFHAAELPHYHRHIIYRGRTNGSSAHLNPRSQRVVSVSGFGDELLDFITAGPKLRKWYGEGERLPTDGGLSEESVVIAESEEEEDSGPHDAVLVTDGSSPTGEQVVLQLVSSRAVVKVLVNDAATAAAATAAFGPYITPIVADLDDEKALVKALRGVRAVVVTGRLGALLLAAPRSQMEHLVLLSSVGATEGFTLKSLLDADSRVLKDPAREEAVMSCNVPFTIVRCSEIRDTPGGSTQLRFAQGSAPFSGEISREDLAKVLTGALAKAPDSGLAFSVTAGGPGGPPKDWTAVLSVLQEAASAQ
eukprot:jgi/Botrbrau1/4066/Bobra.152_3s0022.1